MGRLASRNSTCALAGVSLTLAVVVTLASCTQADSAARSQDVRDSATQEMQAPRDAFASERVQTAPAVALGEISPGIHNLFGWLRECSAVRGRRVLRRLTACGHWA